MTPAEFVKALQLVAIDNVVKGLSEYVSAPPGRRVSEDLSALSAWYRSLGDDRHFANDLLARAADQAVTNVLLVLDGRLAVQPPGQERGRLELRYVSDGTSITLNAPGGEDLSELLPRPASAEGA